MRGTNTVVAHQDQIKVTDGNRRRISKKTLLPASLLLLIMGSALSGLGYQFYASSYQRDQLLAQDGIQHLLKAKGLLSGFSRNPFSIEHVAEMQQEFSDALHSFTQVDNDLRPIPGAAFLLPKYGPHLHAAVHLVALSQALSQIGVDGCDIMDLLISRLYHPVPDQSYGITKADIALIGQKLDAMWASFMTATSEIGQLQPSDEQVDPRIGRLVNVLRQNLPLFQKWLDMLRKVLPATPMLLGIDEPEHYMVEVLDSTELRPGGGFIGNYGTVTLSGGLLTDAHITDTDLLDTPFRTAGLGIPFPPQYSWFDIAKGNWGVRDSNLDADFPTAARAAESNYMSEGGDVPFQGVIAITPLFMQRVLAITGPIAVPEYHETVNAQNLIERIHYHQLGGGTEGPDNIPAPDGHSSLRKHFIALLAEHFLAQVNQVASSHSARFLPLLVDAVRTKDLQVYFNDQTVEAQLHNAQLDAAIQATPGDNLFIVDANIAADKANAFINSTLTDVVNIDPQGNALHHATLSYAWTNPGQDYGSPLYRDYARVYVPSRSVLQKQDGWEVRGTDHAFGHEVWAGFFPLTYGQTRIVTLDWRVPHAATFDGHIWHYQEVIQKQAGTFWKLKLQVMLPQCAITMSRWRTLISGSKQYATLIQPLTQDLHMGVYYAYA